jgi:hypothetical protein
METSWKCLNSENSEGRAHHQDRLYQPPLASDANGQARQTRFPLVPRLRNCAECW